MTHRLARLSKQFKKVYKKLKDSGRYKMETLQIVLNLLLQKESLPEKYQDHPLRGTLQGCRDCHIEGDWILLYEIGLNEDGLEMVIFHRTGNHANLFE